MVSANRKEGASKMVAGLKGKVAAVALSAVLSVGMAPSFAFAGTLTAGGADMKATSEMQAQAAKKTVYVLTKITDAQTNRLMDGGTGSLYNSTSKVTVKFTYNAKGLLAKSKYTRASKVDGKQGSTSKPSVHTWTYNKKNQLVSQKVSNGTIKYTLDSKGRHKKAVAQYAYPVTTTYTYKSGKVSKYTTKLSGQTTNVKLAYKGGKPVTIKETTTRGSGNPSSWTHEISYDARGNVLLSAASPNTYNSKGLLTKRTSSSQNSNGTGGSRTITYTYKAVKVSKSLASKITAQQWALLNDDLNLELSNIHASYGNIALTNLFA